MPLRPIKHLISRLKATECVKIVFTFLLAASVSTGFAQGPAADAVASNPDGAAAAGAGSAAIANGEAIFNQNCKQCHAVNEKVVGPALRDAPKRWGSDARLLNFIKYPEKVIKGGDAYAAGLYKQYQQYMPNHDFLKDGDIKDVIEWIKAESAKPAQSAATATPGAEGGKGGDGAAAAGIDSTTTTIILGALLFVLLLLVVVLVLITTTLNNFLKTKEGITGDEREFIEQRTNWGSVFASPAFRTIVGLVFAIVVGKVVFDQMYAIGIQQGYAPRQPIPFSHKLHAGQYEIDCNYCHTGATKGKNAAIPSVNICMNCHNSIKTESPYMKKIWAAVETDQPIEWVRIHNLPDLAYFNHQQHTVVGKIECQTCHGPIQEMEVVQQYSPLTMGWCINCHRETVVQTQGNAYYDNLLQLHNQAKAGKSMTVENIGGLECSKCHY